MTWKTILFFCASTHRGEGLGKGRWEGRGKGRRVSMTVPTVRHKIQKMHIFFYACLPTGLQSRHIITKLPWKPICKFSISWNKPPPTSTVTSPSSDTNTHSHTSLQHEKRAGYQFLIAGIYQQKKLLCVHIYDNSKCSCVLAVIYHIISF